MPVDTLDPVFFEQHIARAKAVETFAVAEVFYGTPAPVVLASMFQE